VSYQRLASCSASPSKTICSYKYGSLEESVGRRSACSLRQLPSPDAHPVRRGRTKKVEDWLKKAMVEGMDDVLNAPEIQGSHVLIQVEVKSAKAWGG